MFTVASVSVTPLQSSSTRLPQTSGTRAPTSSSASLQSVPPQTSGGSPSMSLSRMVKVQVAETGLQVSLRVQGSLSMQSAGEPQMRPAMQPVVRLQDEPTGQSAGTGVWMQLPESPHVSLVQETPSSQLAASVQPSRVQETPSPMYPAMHAHVNAVTVSVHVACGAQLSVPRAHSFTGMADVHTRPSPE